MGHFIHHTKTALAVSFMVVFLGMGSHSSNAEENSSRKETFLNSIGMRFVFIDSGSFMMGSGLSPLEIKDKFGGKAKWYDDECPQHKVTLTKSFYIQTTEVTQKQWISVMGVNHSEFKNCGDNCPVERVSWYDAQEFITRLNNKENTEKYRLPTEAEWEYACRAGSTTAFCFGNDKTMLNKYAWYNTNSRNWAHQVDQKKPNIWGLYDMHGNVWEWCQDWYSEYPDEEVTDPAGPVSGSHRVSKGGSWRSASRFCRSAHRYGVDPAYRRPTRGFRVAMDP
jgi:formylglycine-generating enzyme required for sulfatase activity